METSVTVAIIAGAVTSVGWLVNYWLTSRREEQRRSTEAQLKYVERQLEELYGPLAFLLFEGRRAFKDLLESLGRSYVFVAGESLPEDELSTWLFWTEAEFLPRNEKIRTLMMARTHLIEGPKFSDNYVAFLDYCNSWAIGHKRWKEQGVKYSWRSNINWPEQFEAEALKTFEELKMRHSKLVGKLS